MLVKQSHKSGRLAQHDVRLIEGVFEFTEKAARDVMTPRTDVVALPNTIDVEAAADRIAEAGRSRYPVYDGSVDNIVGIVHAKQVLRAVREEPTQPITQLIRDPLYVPGTREVEDVLTDMKRLKTQMAVVLDEFGGTAGIVTMEDLLEEIVGEIYDEYDVAGLVPVTAADGVTVGGDMEIDDLNRRYGLKLDSEHYSSVGGYIFGQLGRLPKPGDRISEAGTTLEVVKMDGRRVGTIRVVVPRKPGSGETKKPTG